MSATRKKPRRLPLPRAEWLIGFTLFVVAGFLAVLTILYVRQAAELQRAYARTDALASQVKGLGGKPVAGARGDRGESVIGPQGPKGDQGDPGADAPTITPSPGASGAAGKGGKDGKDGADSVVPGPSGPPGQDATGQPGQDGKDGTDGRDGSDGRPPAGWTFEYGGATYTCQPVDGFDTANPRYHCDAAAPDPAPEKKNSGPKPLSLALDPNRKRW